ncbi:MAG: head GIN domain-containing protein [Flavobacteriales bacterium]|nr:head GIN domain-containing protein [Flavobacteriales bacterium]
MKNYFLLLLFALSFWGCGIDCLKGIGTAVEEERSVGEFSAIRLSSSFNVVIRDRVLSDRNKLVVSAQKNLAEKITTQVKGGVLVIDGEGCFTASEPIEVFVYVNEVSKITSDGSGNISSDNAIRGDNLEIISDGSGEIRLRLKVNKTEVYHNGSGNVSIQGQTNALLIKADGSGDTNCKALSANDAEATNNGSGDVSVFATEDMALKLRGSGGITYNGNPKKFTQDDDGSGEISHGSEQ